MEFLLKTPTGKGIVLECDGKAYHQSEGAMVHDLYREKELKNMGYDVYRIWPTNWFENDEHEMQKLINYLSEHYSENCPENLEVLPKSLSDKILTAADSKTREGAGNDL